MTTVLAAPSGASDRMDPNPPLGTPSRRRRGRLSYGLALVWTGFVVFGAVLADVLPLPSYEVISALDPQSAPGWRFEEMLGTDVVGRSVLSRLVYGGRQSLVIGLLSTAIAMSAGLVIGVTAGYFRGWADRALSVVLDTALSIPGLVLLLAVASIGKRDVATVVLGLSLYGTPTFARLARASTLGAAKRDFVTAARGLGHGHRRILFHEVVPNVLPAVTSFVFVYMAVAIVAEGSMSFLGLGIPPPAPSWGGMINDARPYLESDPHLVIVPALVLVMTVVSLTVLGERFRQRYEPRAAALA